MTGMAAQVQPPAEPPNASSSFQLLLAQFSAKLSEEHQREVSELHTQIAKLSCLRSNGAPKSSSDSACSVATDQLGPSAAQTGQDEASAEDERGSGLDDSKKQILGFQESSQAATEQGAGIVAPRAAFHEPPEIGSTDKELAADGLHMPVHFTSEGADAEADAIVPKSSSIQSIKSLEIPQVREPRSKSWYKEKRDRGSVASRAAHIIDRDTYPSEQPGTRGGNGSDDLVKMFFTSWRQFVQDMDQLLNFHLRKSWDASTCLPQVLERHHELAVGANARTLSPHSGWRMAWDIIGMSFLLYDIIAIPLVAFQPASTVFTVTMDWCTMIYWTLDMVASSVTGYVSQGTAVMDRGLIFKHYMKGWFPLDITVVSLDWVSSGMDLMQSTGDAEAAKSGRMIRILRVLRIARLLRLGKLARVVSVFKDVIDSEGTFIWLNIGKLIVAMILVNHLQACGWYAIRDATEPTWRMETAGFKETSLAFRYTTSLHYSFTQFIEPAPQPITVGERLYAILVWINSLVLFSSIVGSVSASITQLFGAHEDKSQQVWLLRRYMKQRAIESGLKFRVMRYIEYSMTVQEALVSDHRIHLLQHLSPQLHDELTFAVYFSCLRAHPLFQKLMHVADHTMTSLCQTALTQQHLASGDWLLNAGMEEGGLHMVVTGRLQYVKAEELDLEDPQVEQFAAGDWACEAALWTLWTCVGSSRTNEECTLVQIDSEMHAHAVVKDAAARVKAASYAKQYVQWLSSKQWRNLTDISWKDTMMEIVEGFMRADEQVEVYTGWGAAVDLSLMGAVKRLTVTRQSVMGRVSMASRSSTQSQGVSSHGGRGKLSMNSNFSTISGNNGASFTSSTGYDQSSSSSFGPERAMAPVISQVQS